MPEMTRWGVECTRPFCGARVFHGLYGFETQAQAGNAWNNRFNPANTNLAGQKLLEKVTK